MEGDAGAAPGGRLGARLPCPGLSPRGQCRLASGPHTSSPGLGSQLCLEALHLPGVGSALKAPVLFLSRPAPPDRGSKGGPG